MRLAYRFTTIFLKNETVFLHVLASPGHPQGDSLYISDGVQAFTLLVIFLLYYDKMFTKMNNFLYTGIVNILL
jgi:hypothetical protein